ncbi:MAG: glycosyltransferase [Gemmataceae bacterium]
MDGQHPPPNSAGWHLSLVIPAYNEEAGISEAIAEAEVALAQITREYEILVVDDGSKDATARLVEEAGRKNPRVQLLALAPNKGYGAALRAGFEAARYDRVAFTDADCQFHLEDLTPLLEFTKDHDLAVGYRVDRQDPVERRFYSWGYNVLIRALMGTRVRDCDCALKVFRKEALLKSLPETSGFFINTEMLTRARQLNFSIAQTGVRHRPRVRGTSKVSVLDIPRTLSSLLPFWWSRVVFPGPASTARAGGPFSRLVGFSLLMVAAALLLFTRLSNPLQEPQEARYAEIPRQMLTTDNWIVPVLHGEPYLDKPPLLYWLVMASYSVFGVHDWAARLVPCTAIFLCILLTYAWGRRTLGHAAGLAGAGILCLSARFIFLGRFLTMDAVLCLCTLAALAAAHLALTSSPKRPDSTGRSIHWTWWMLSAAACGLGLLTKGPVVLALACPPVIICQLLDQRFAKPLVSSWAGYLAIALGMAAPWYIAMSVRQPGFPMEFFWKHNIERFVSPFDHQEPFWYFLPSLFLGMLPWSLLLPGLVGFLGHPSLRTGIRRPAALGYFLATSLWGLLFFSAAGCKRATYILPVMPPLALALGYYLAIGQPGAEFLRLGRALLARGYGLAHQAIWLTSALGVVIAGLAVKESLFKPTQAIVAVGVAMVMGGAFYRVRTRLSTIRAWWLTAVVTFGMLFTAVYLVLPAYARKYSMRGQVRRFEEEARTTPIRLACYPKSWDSVSFYLQAPSLNIYPEDRCRQLVADLASNPETLLFVKSGKPLETLLRALPPSLQFEREGRQGGVLVGRVHRRLREIDTVHADRIP